MKDYPAGSFPILKGLYFDERSWDGSDIFRPSDDTAWIFITNRVKNVLSAKTKNIRFVPLEDVEHMPGSP